MGALGQLQHNMWARVTGVEAEVRQSPTWTRGHGLSRPGNHV